MERSQTSVTERLENQTRPDKSRVLINSFHYMINVSIIVGAMWVCSVLLHLLALQPTGGFSLLSDFLPLCSFFTLLSPPSYSHYFQIFFNACNPSLSWSPSSSGTYRFPLGVGSSTTRYEMLLLNLRRELKIQVYTNSKLTFWATSPKSDIR
jgi:hypothetical protein